jgi:hypothetical protein
MENITFSADEKLVEAAREARVASRRPSTTNFAAGSRSTPR